MKQSSISILTLAACLAALSGRAFAQSAPLPMRSTGGMSAAAPAERAQEPKPAKSEGADKVRVRLAEVISMLEEEQLSPEQQRKALAKLTEVVDRLDKERATAGANRSLGGMTLGSGAQGGVAHGLGGGMATAPVAPRLLSGQRVVTVEGTEPGNDKPARARVLGVPLPPQPGMPSAAPEAPQPPAPPRPARAPRAPRAEGGQVEVTEPAVPGAAPQVWRARAQAGEPATVEGQATEPGTTERPVRWRAVKPVPGEPAQVEIVELSPGNYAVQAKKAVDMERAHAEAAQKHAEEARVHAAQALEQARAAQRDAERMRADAETRAAEAREVARRYVERAQDQAGRIRVVEEAKAAETPQPASGDPFAARARGRARAVETKPAPAPSPANEEAQIRAELEQMQAEMREIRELLKQIRTRARQDEAKDEAKDEAPQAK